MGKANASVMVDNNNNNNKNKKDCLLYVVNNDYAIHGAVRHIAYFVCNNCIYLFFATDVSQTGF